MIRTACILLLWLLVTLVARAGEPGKRQPGRGELLYQTYCIGCHDTHVHWRERELARDWQSLQSEVIRWQTFSRLKWTPKDIAAVTDYLNTLYYHFPASAKP